jgi:hypothetical protein
MVQSVVIVIVWGLMACSAAPGKPVESNDVSTGVLFNSVFSVMSLISWRIIAPQQHYNKTK